MPSHRSPTIIVLYDGDRPHWRTELWALKANDPRNQIKLINIRGVQFSAHAWGFAPESLAMTLHVRDFAGYWHVDLDAMRLLQRAVGLTPLETKPLEPKPLETKNGDLLGLRFVFDTLSVIRIDKFDRLALNSVLVKHLHDGLLECSNDDCLSTELNDNNSWA